MRGWNGDGVLGRCRCLWIAAAACGLLLAVWKRVLPNSRHMPSGHCVHDARALLGCLVQAAQPLGISNDVANPVVV